MSIARAVKPGQGQARRQGPRSDSLGGDPRLPAWPSSPGAAPRLPVARGAAFIPLCQGLSNRINKFISNGKEPTTTINHSGWILGLAWIWIWVCRQSINRPTTIALSIIQVNQSYHSQHPRPPTNQSSLASLQDQSIRVRVRVGSLIVNWNFTTTSTTTRSLGRSLP